MVTAPNSRCPVSLGEELGRLTVIGFDRNKFGQTMAVCRCKCGNTHSATVTKVSSGWTGSCGCARTDKGYTDSTSAIASTVKTTYKHRAKKLGLKFELTIENVRSLITSSCAYCGIEPYRTITIVRKTKIHSLTCNGIDRIDNSKGYTAENVASCCQNCQYAKREMNFSDFKAWATRLANHLGQHNAAKADESVVGSKQLTMIGGPALGYQSERTT